jgi:hypothetical protein
MDVIAGENDMGHEAIHAHGDTLEVLAPIPPGEKQVVVTYLLPAGGEFRLWLDHAVIEMGIMVADTNATVRQGGLVPAGVTTFEGARYLRLDGANLPPGDQVVLELASRPLAAGDLWWVVVGLAAAALAGGFAWGTRQRRGGAEADTLAAQIAAMDRNPSIANDPGWPERRRQLLATLAATLARKKDAS